MNEKELRAELAILRNAMLIIADTQWSDAPDTKVTAADAAEAMRGIAIATLERVTS